MREWRPKWTRIAVASASIAIVAVTAFFAGLWIGGTYERYRFVYAAPRHEAIRSAVARLTGAERSHGEFQQDLWVAHGVAPNKRDGYYVDVGSADGVKISNTKLLDDLGWKGVCIDPFPRHMESRTCLVVRQPVFSESGKRVKFRAAGDLGGIEETLNKRLQNSTAAAKEVEFVTATLDEILTKARAPQYIDYMSLDVEGAEYDALRGLSLDVYQIGAFTIEHNYDQAKREAIHRLLDAKGYVRVRSWDVDDWYVNRNLAPRYPNFIAFCGVRTACPY